MLRFSIMLLVLAAAGCAYDPLGPWVEAPPAPTGDAGTPADAGEALLADAGTDGGSSDRASPSFRPCFEGESGVPAQADGGLALRCGGLVTMAMPPAPPSGTRLRSGGFAAQTKTCKDVGGTRRCFTGGFGP